MGAAPAARPVTTKESHDGVSHALRLRWGCSSMQGWRPYMEDFHFCHHSLGGDWSDTAAFGVLDGHGGREVALFCQQRLPQQIAGRRRIEVETKVSNFLTDGWRGLVDHDDTPTGHAGRSAAQAAAAAEALKSALEGMDKMLENEPEYLRSLRIMTGDGRDQQVGASRVGCTACICLLQASFIIIGNVGDSRAVLSKNGLAIPLSVDHKPNLPGERERIHRAGGTVDQQDFAGFTTHRVNGNLNLSRSLGDLDYKRNPRLAAKEQLVSSSPDLIEKRRDHEDEFLLIASDGIWDRISNQEAVDLVLERLSNDVRLSSITEALLDRCFAPDLAATSGLGGDNMTALLIWLQPSQESPYSTCSDGTFPYAPDTCMTREQEMGKASIFANGLLCSCSPQGKYSL